MSPRRADTKFRTRTQKPAVSKQTRTMQVAIIFASLLAAALASVGCTSVNRGSGCSDAWPQQWPTCSSLGCISATASHSRCDQNGITADIDTFCYGNGQSCNDTAYPACVKIQTRMLCAVNFPRCSALNGVVPICRTACLRGYYAQTPSDALTGCLIYEGRGSVLNSAPPACVDVADWLNDTAACDFMTSSSTSGAPVTSRSESVSESESDSTSTSRSESESVSESYSVSHSGSASHSESTSRSYSGSAAMDLSSSELDVAATSAPLAIALIGVATFILCNV
jgi:hypothetical protein